MKEADIQREIVKALRQLGFIVLRLNAGKTQHNVKLCEPGTPDLLAIGHEVTLWIEVKAPGGKLRDTQVEMHKQLRKRGQLVAVCDSVDSAVSAAMFNSV